MRGLNLLVFCLSPLQGLCKFCHNNFHWIASNALIYCPFRAMYEITDFVLVLKGRCLETMDANPWITTYMIKALKGPQKETKHLVYYKLVYL